MDYDRDGADANCRHCGADIWFDVGPGPSTCPACGKNYQYTDAELERQRLDDIISGERALAGMQDNWKKLQFLHGLKPGRSADEVKMLDEIMDEFDQMFEADRVRQGLPPMYEELCEP